MGYPQPRLFQGGPAYSETAGHGAQMNALQSPEEIFSAGDPGYYVPVYWPAGPIGFDTVLGRRWSDNNDDPVYDHLFQVNDDGSAIDLGEYGDPHYYSHYPNLHAYRGPDSPLVFSTNDFFGTQSVYSSTDLATPIYALDNPGRLFKIQWCGQADRLAMLCDVSAFDSWEIRLINLDGSGLSSHAIPRSGILSYPLCWLPSDRVLWTTEPDYGSWPDVDWSHAGLAITDLSGTVLDTIAHGFGPTADKVCAGYFTGHADAEVLDEWTAVFAYIMVDWNDPELPGNRMMNTCAQLVSVSDDVLAYPQTVQMFEKAPFQGVGLEPDVRVKTLAGQWVAAWPYHEST